MLAVFMVLSVVGCKENKKKKPPKVVIRDKVILREPSNDNSNVDTSKPIDKVEDVTTRAKRQLLPEPEEEGEKISFDELHKEEYVPEFEYKVAGMGQMFWLVEFLSASLPEQFAYLCLQFGKLFPGFEYLGVISK